MKTTKAILLTMTRYVGWLLCSSSTVVAAYIAVYQFIHRSEFSEGQSSACDLGVQGSIGMLMLLPGILGILMVFVVKRIRKETKTTLWLLFVVLFSIFLGLVITGSLMKARYGISC